MIKTDDYIREIVFIFFIRFRVIMGTALVITLAALAIAFYMPPVYAVSGTIFIRSKTIEKNPESLDAEPQKILELSKEDLFSEIEILKSHDVIANTITTLKITHPELTLHSDSAAGNGVPVVQDTGIPDADPVMDDVRIIRGIQGNLETEILPGSHIIKVTLLSKTPLKALVILEQLLNEYITYRAQIYNPAQAGTFYEAQVSTYNTNLIRLEKELNALAEQADTADPLKEIENNLVIKKDLEQQLNLARAGWIDKKRSYEKLKEALKTRDVQFFSFLDNLTITEFADKLQTLIIERGNLLRKYHPESSRIRNLDEQVEETYALLKGEAQAYLRDQENRFEILQDTIQSIETKLAEINLRNIELHRHSIEYNRIKRDLDLQEASYKTLAKRLEQTLINRASDEKNLSAATVASKPFFSGSPIFPNKKLMIPVGILVGLISGLSLGFLAEYFDHTVKRPEDIGKFLDLPVILSMPMKR